MASLGEVSNVLSTTGEVSNALSTLAGEDGSAHKREQLACWLGLAAGGEVSDVD